MNHPNKTTSLSTNTIYDRPANILCQLNKIIECASKTAFYKDKLQGIGHMSSLSDIVSIPSTPIDILRTRSLVDMVTNPSKVQWITGRLLGQTSRNIPVVEGSKETSRRYDIFRDALRDTLPIVDILNAIVLTDPLRRNFAAEIGTIMGYMGIQSHVFVNDGSMLPYDRINQLNPDILVIASDEIDESLLPKQIRLAITFRRSHSLSHIPQLDIYMVDEFGFLGHTTNLKRWVVYNDQYLFEISSSGKLIVTSLLNYVQPLLRINTDDTVIELTKYHIALGKLSG